MTRINRIEDKIDHIAESISGINATLAAQHESLKEHIRRTELLEREIKPIRNHVVRMQGAMKLVGASSLVIGLIETLLHLSKSVK